MSVCEVIELAVLDYNAKIINIFGQGSERPTKFGVDGFEVQFKIKILEDNKIYSLVFQSAERTDNLKDYNGYEMETANDESAKVERNYNYGQSLIAELKQKSESLCHVWLYYGSEMKIKVMVQYFVDSWKKIIEDYDNEVSNDYDDDLFRKEARSIGHIINMFGGRDAMLAVHSNLPNSMKRLVELSWSGIGDWLG